MGEILDTPASLWALLFFFFFLSFGLFALWALFSEMGWVRLYLVRRPLG